MERFYACALVGAFIVKGGKEESGLYTSLLQASSAKCFYGIGTDDSVLVFYHLGAGTQWDTGGFRDYSTADSSRAFAAAAPPQREQQVHSLNLRK